jgi:uracil phosphoribosyltransferase
MYEHIQHPLIEDKLRLLRDEKTSSAVFRKNLKDIATLMAFRVCEELPLESQTIQTPIASCTVKRLNTKTPITLVSILRAGNGLLNGMLELIDTAQVAHLGLARDENTLRPVEYYKNFPTHCGHTIILDPMLATGHSASACIDKVKEQSIASLKFVCLLASRKGLEHLQSEHPDVKIYCAAIDEELNAKGYIVPGLGDAGDRIYNAKH